MRCPIPTGHLQQGGASQRRIRARIAPPACAARAHRPARIRAVRAHQLGARPRDHPPARHGRHRALGAGGGDAAQLCRPARHARLRQHVAAVLPQARREPALSRLHVRRRCATKPGSEPTAAFPASGRKPPRKRSSTSSGATMPRSPMCTSCATSMPPGAGAVGWWSSIPCAPRSPSRPTCISRPGRAPTSFWVSRSPSSWSGSAPITPPSSPSM